MVGGPLWLRKEAVDKRSVALNVGGEVDAHSAPKLADKAIAAAGADTSRLVMDLGELRFGGAHLVGVLVALDDWMRSREGFLLVACPPDSEVRTVFELTGADRSLQIFDTREEALVALTNGGPR